MKLNLLRGFSILLISISLVSGCKKAVEQAAVAPPATTGTILHDSTLTGVNTTQNPYPRVPSI